VKKFLMSIGIGAGIQSVGNFAALFPMFILQGGGHSGGGNATISALLLSGLFAMAPAIVAGAAIMHFSGGQVQGWVSILFVWAFSIFLSSSRKLFNRF